MMKGTPGQQSSMMDLVHCTPVSVSRPPQGGIYTPSFDMCGCSTSNSVFDVSAQTITLCWPSRLVYVPS